MLCVKVGAAARFRAAAVINMVCKLCHILVNRSYIDTSGRGDLAHQLLGAARGGTQCARGWEGTAMGLSVPSQEHWELPGNSASSLSSAPIGCSSSPARVPGDTAAASAATPQNSEVGVGLGHHTQSVVQREAD